MDAGGSAAANVVAERLLGCGRDDLACQRQPQVRVLEIAGRRIERLLFLQTGDDFLVGRERIVRVGPVRVVRLPWQPRGMGQDAAKGIDPNFRDLLYSGVRWDV